MKRRSAAALLAVSLGWAVHVGAAPRSLEASSASELPAKPTGPISVEYRLSAQPAVGVPLTITVTARVENDVGTLGIEANATSPRSVLVTPPQRATAGDGNYVWELTVVPLAAEAGYLSVIVSGASEGVAQASSVTISLRSAAAPAEAALSATANGEALIALPVQESP
jgi:hypothetical protein